jgi:hypothetical protein
VNGVPKWRLAAGILVLAALGFFAAVLGPVYVRAFEFHRFVSGLTHNVDTRDRSDDALLRMVLAKSRSLNLPVNASGVQITRSGGEAHIDARYMVKVDLPGYTVELHF